MKSSDIQVVAAVGGKSVDLGTSQISMILWGTTWLLVEEMGLSFCDGREGVESFLVNSQVLLARITKAFRGPRLDVNTVSCPNCKGQQFF